MYRNVCQLSIRQLLNMCGRSCSAQVVCLLQLLTKSCSAMHVATWEDQTSEQGRREPPSSGGAMIATKLAFRSMRWLPMTLSTPSSAANVRYYLQHAGLKLQVQRLIGVLSVMKDRNTMRCHIMFMTWIHHLNPNLRKRLMTLPTHGRLRMMSLGTCKMTAPAPKASTSLIMWLMMML